MGAGEHARGMIVWTQASAAMTGMARSCPEGSLFRVTLIQAQKNWATRALGYRDGLRVRSMQTSDVWSTAHLSDVPVASARLSAHCRNVPAQKEEDE